VVLVGAVGLIGNGFTTPLLTGDSGVVGAGTAAGHAGGPQNPVSPGTAVGYHMRGAGPAVIIVAQGVGIGQTVISGHGICAGVGAGAASTAAGCAGLPGPIDTTGSSHGRTGPAAGAIGGSVGVAAVTGGVAVNSAGGSSGAGTLIGRHAGITAAAIGGSVGVAAVTDGIGVGPAGAPVRRAIAGVTAGRSRTGSHRIGASSLGGGSVALTADAGIVTDIPVLGVVGVIVVFIRLEQAVIGLGGVVCIGVGPTVHTAGVVEDQHGQGLHRRGDKGRVFLVVPHVVDGQNQTGSKEQQAPE